MRAPAKINLGLEVIRRREDGFHDINTLFIPIDLYDELLMAPRSDGTIELRVEGNAELGAGSDNLCVRAATALQEHCGGKQRGLDMELIKHIPMGAGLGGGSSDAAAALRGATRLWGCEDIDNRILRDVALSLGSDVPFFLDDGVAQASSRGELLRRLDLELPFAILLINPGIHVPTPWAYSQVGRIGERAASDLPALLAEGVRDPEILRRNVVNDFEPAIFSAHPVLAAIKHRLYDAGALFALMSGSGSTMFGLFPNADIAREAVGYFKEYWNVVARQVPRNQGRSDSSISPL
jgi:4-diphosphocytidyl-2-C-methyl-D-erythritol kinase